MDPHGRELARIPAHPRLAHLLLEARLRGLGRLGAELAALLSDRDLLRAARTGPTARDADILTRLELLRGEWAGGAAADRGGLARVRRSVELFRRMAGESAPPGAAGAGGGIQRAPAVEVGLLLACAYPDRIGRARGGAEGRFALSNGRGAAFAHPDRLARSEFIVAVELDDRDREARIQLAAGLDREALEAAAGRAHRAARRGAVVGARRGGGGAAHRAARRAGAGRAADPSAAARARRGRDARGLRALGIDALPWDDDCRNLQARVELARARSLPGTADWPAFDEAALLGSIDEWLAPWLDGITRRATSRACRSPRRCVHASATSASAGSTTGCRPT